MLSWLRKQPAPAPEPAPLPVSPGAREREITSLFISIENYVGLAEAVPLARLAPFINDYFERCCGPIDTEGGTIDKFIGDRVMAMFGAPVEIRDHAARACAAALRIQTAIADLRLRLRADKEPWPPIARQLRVRIGLNSGSALVGNIGSRTRFTYTMMGDSVNLAARLETGAKQLGARIVCSESTRDECERASPGLILFRPLSFSFVKGKLRPTRLFEPMAFESRAKPEVRACIDTFSSAVHHYERGAWAEAIAGFPESEARARPVHSHSGSARQPFCVLSRACPSPARYASGRPVSAALRSCG